MTHTDDALVERIQELTETSITMTRKQMDSYDYIRWSLTNDIAQKIIALVRADERKRIREALLSDDVLFAVHGLDSAEALQAAIAAIGIGEERGNEQ